jgi:hypothetical protein
MGRSCIGLLSRWVKLGLNLSPELKRGHANLVGFLFAELIISFTPGDRAQSGRPSRPARALAGRGGANRAALTGLADMALRALR